jgi:hypothetical protein
MLWSLVATGNGFKQNYQENTLWSNLVEGVKEKRIDRGGAWGEHVLLILGAIKLGGVKKLNKMDECTNYLFV